MSKGSQIKTYQLINLIQKLTVYETNHSFYIIGSNSSENLFKVIKIDRTCDPKILSYSEDMHEYDQYEINELISMINIDNQPGKTPVNGINNGIIRQFNAFVLLGFIKFLEGYYMVLVTKQLPVAVIGYHVIYTIEEASMIYIPYVEKTNQKEVNQDEQRYLKMFQAIDLRQNFYYSFTYDLTNTLQHNFAFIKQTENTSSTNPTSNSVKLIGGKNKPCSKFLWNEFLLQPILKKISYQWVVYLIHGYLSQSSINIYGCTVFVTLIARRSQKYAGTRFLKRGGTNEGYVANEVETEQIVHNGSVSSFQKGYFTSFVHTRGSIPCFWSQDPKAVPKPPINIDVVDPFATVAARHFRQLLSRFGAPVIILNLVKMREKKPQESILANEYKLSLDYLKQFLPHDNFIDYICLDMAKLNKTDKGNVMNRIYEIAENCILRTKFFKNFSDSKTSEKTHREYTLQNGTVRVNCVDCLDRTNTAMYVIGKCALAHQLHALGILSTPYLGQESLCERMLIDLYEKCGDAIAQQYAGSQLVHRVDTYGKNSIASQSRDMIHTISRYYSNAFADADKQNSINIFLGIFEPAMYNYNIWDLTTDCYLHDSYIMQPWKMSKKYIEWIDSKLFKCLPLPYELEFKSINDFKYVEQIKSELDPKISLFDDFYKPDELTAFHEIFYFNNLNTNRITNNIPSQGFTGNIMAILDPFKFKKKSITGLSKSQQNQTNESSLSLQTSSDDDLTDDSISFTPEFSLKQTNNVEKIKSSNRVVVKNRDLRIFEISDKSLDIYKKYAQDAQRDEITYQNNKASQVYRNFFLDEKFTNDPIKSISDKSMSVYLNHLNVGCYGGAAIKEPSDKNIKIYEAFLKEKESLKESSQYYDSEFGNFGSSDIAYNRVKFSLT
ncbi:unnamed protein product [Brachionus calyciflorus]|uniref:SAC domain-containing protein n=1 Tax=Brachionus calyciflorus TaxID=104777 RepID=A0A813UWX5_9BILA|nr:unnamed protein product [Brachionus calyciflorus]